MKLYIMKPEHARGKPGVLLFIHGGVWLAVTSRTISACCETSSLDQGIGVFLNIPRFRGRIPNPAGRNLCCSRMGRYPWRQIRGRR